jgi:hypothetical protein
LPLPLHCDRESISNEGEYCQRQPKIDPLSATEI